MTQTSSCTEPVGSADLMKLSGASFRQIDYWTRIGLLPVLEPRVGSGHKRLYPPEMIDRARALSRWFGTMDPRGSGYVNRERLVEVLDANGDTPVRLAPGIYIIPAELMAA